MATIMMIHGAWHWGACFLKVANMLAEKGHTVICPDLATHGYDLTEPGSVADMDQYTGSAQRAIEALPGKVVLLGHSMGGVSCTYLGEKFADRVEKIIYLAAFLCADGKCANDYIFSPPYTGDPAAAELFQLLSADPHGIRLALADVPLVKTAFYADCSDHDVAIAAKNVIAVTPAAANIWPTKTTSERFGQIPCTYIECTQDKAIPIAIQRIMQTEAAAMAPHLSVVTMDASHSPFFSQPVALADLIHRACS